jgi:hypothetical protein
MRSYVVHNADGNILRAGVTDSDVAQAFSGEFEIECDWPADLENYTVVDGALSRKPQADIDAAAASQAWHKLRSLRDTLLQASDWTQSIDSPLNNEQKQLWRTYRQALRDLPSSTTDPSNPTWPDKP